MLVIFIFRGKGACRSEAAWEGTGMDPEFFRSMVLPALATVKLSAIVEACGVAKGTASNWRAGSGPLTRPTGRRWLN